MDLELLREAWPGLIVGARIAGGQRYLAFAGEYGGARVVVRRSARPPESLEWELDLLVHLAASGIDVPIVVPAINGAPHRYGWHVQRFIEGRHPDRTQGIDLAPILGEVHRVTRGWAQRPGAASAQDLLWRSDAGDVDLTEIPSHLAMELRSAWRDAGVDARCVVHGNPHPGTVIVRPGGSVALIDWDQARVDDPLFDAPTTAVQRRAALAWEIAVCWGPDPQHAASLVRPFVDSKPL